MAPPAVPQAAAQTVTADDVAGFTVTVLSHRDRNTPVKGMRISPEDIGQNGHNFRYCDGETGIEDLSQFVNRRETCPPVVLKVMNEFGIEDLRNARIYTTARNLPRGETGYESRGQIARQVFEEMAGGEGAIPAEWEVFGAMSAVPVTLDITQPGVEFIAGEDGKLAVLLPAEAVDDLDRIARDLSAEQAAKDAAEAAEMAASLPEEEAQEARAAAPDMEM